MHRVTLPTAVDADGKPEDTVELTATVCFKGKGGPIRWCVAGSAGGSTVLRVGDVAKPWQGF